MLLEQHLIWWAYMVAAVCLPCYYVPQIRKFLNGGAGVGDWCVRSDMWQLAFRVPALAFSVFVMPSLPLFVATTLDMCGRTARIFAARASQRRFAAAHRAGKPEEAPAAPVAGKGQAPRVLPMLLIGSSFDADSSDRGVAVTSCGAGW
jgi:hypothetical protein